MNTEKKGFFDSVKTRLIFVVIAIMAIPLLISVIISYNASHTEAVDNMVEMNNAQVNLVMHDFQTIVLQNKQVLQSVANSQTARDVLKGTADNEAVVAWLVRTDKAVGDGNSMVITGPDGMQVLRASGDCVDVSGREYFQDCKKTLDFVISDQNISKTNGKRICTFIYPVLDDDGSFLGAVQRNYDLENFNELVLNEMGSNKQDIFIGDNNGDLIAHTSMDLSGGEPINFSAQQWYTESRSNSNAMGSYDSKFNGGNWKMSYEREPITGWVTVIATDKSDALKNANKMLTVIIAAGVVMLIISAAVAFLLARSFTDPIIAINEAIAKLAGGEFRKLDRYTDRKDEFGDIVKNTNELVSRLGEIVGNIQKAAQVLSTSAGELAGTSGQIASTADDVSQAVDGIAKGATDQADSVERANGNLTTLSEAIRNVSEDAQHLAESAIQMNDASQSSANALNQLSNNMEIMERSVATVGESMRATNEAVQSVNKKVDGITSIATQTNLLALNASIEAARAGDAGRGFAIVAEEIGSLAKESADTADKIRAEMQNLLRHAEEASGKTEEIAKIGQDVNSVLAETVDRIRGLIGEVTVTVDGVTNISGLAEECDASKNLIVDAMSSLSAISEENAASTEETSASMEELNATVSVLASSADELNRVAEELENDLKFFRL